MSHVAMGWGGEFDLIRRLVGPDRDLPGGVLVGPGDDCAVWEDGLVASTDLAVEGVHFRFDWISPVEAGQRAAAAALSDLAAVAARPIGVLLSMALPGSHPSEQAERLQAGVRRACDLEAVPILGGDLSRSVGTVTLAVSVLGRSRGPVLRSGVQPGHDLWVTGTLGGSAAAVALWREGKEPGGPLREAFAAPRPRIREALWLSERVSLGGLIDLSDGLAGDAGHLAAASGVAIHLDPATLPLHSALSEARLEGLDPLRLALSGGEDFELCFSAPPGSLDDWRDPFQDSFGLPLTRIGSAVEGEGVYLAGAGETAPLTGLGGFDHFEGEETE
jgi:thiamine-monophosphate kinase